MYERSRADESHVLLGKIHSISYEPLVNIKDEYRDHMFFHALTFAGSRGSCLNTRPSGRVFKHRPRDPASVIAMKQTCVIVILAYFT